MDWQYAGANTSENLSRRIEPDEAVDTSGRPRDIIGRITSVTRGPGGGPQAQISVEQDGTRMDSWSDAANESWRFMAIESELENVRFSGAATIEQYIVFVGIRYKHVRCTNSKLRVLYTHDPSAK